MISIGTVVLILLGILSFIVTFLIWRASNRPSEADMEEALNRRLGNEFGPGSGRYEGSSHKLDLISIEVEEQSDPIYKLIRHFTSEFKGITTIIVKVTEDTAPEASQLESQLSDFGYKSEILKIDVRKDEITYVVGATDPRRVQNLFDDLRKSIDQLLAESDID